MYAENRKIYRRLYDCHGGMHFTPSHTNVCKFYNFQPTFSQLIFHLKLLKLGTVTKVRMLFLVLVLFFDLFKFSAAILEKGLLHGYRLINAMKKGTYSTCLEKTNI